ncbi:MAG: hypothetical protein WAQ24_01640 [Candidatus Saccharimonadales bacterium]
MKKVKKFLNQYWRIGAVLLLVATLLSGLLIFRLDSLVVGYSATEQASQQTSSSLRAIYNDPVNAPYKLLVWLSLKCGFHSLLATRIAAVTIALGIAALFYWVASRWYSKRITLFATLMLVTSSSFLHAGRNGSALILQMASLLLIGAVLYFQYSPHRLYKLYIMTALFALCVYIPGMVWLELFGLWLLRKYIIKIFRQLSHLHAALILWLGLLLTLPLLWVGAHNWTVLHAIVGIPTSAPSLSTLFESTKHFVSAFLYRGYWSPETWLYGAPLLNIGEVLFFIAGLYGCLKKPRLRFNFFLFICAAITAFLVILSGGVSITILVPFVYFIIAGGIFLVLDEWLSTFPRNPIAQGFGISLIGIFVAFSVLYHMQAYFKAWPNAPETKQVYVVNPRP